MSKCFTESEQKKAVIELEVLAIHFIIRQFRRYVYHRPLVYFFNLKDKSSKLSPIRLELSEYNFNVEYIRGRDNVGADALSRISISYLKIKENQVLAVTTRSKSKNKLIKQIEQVQPVSDCDILQVYYKYSHQFSRNIARIRTEIIDHDEHYIKLRIQFYRKCSKLLSVDSEFVNA